MAALLVSLSLMGLLLSMALPVWSQQARREREAELIFRGEQYARAIALYQRRQPGALPSDLDMLVEQRYLRRQYRDPMTRDGTFRILRRSEQALQNVGGVAGEVGGGAGEIGAAAPPTGSRFGRTTGADEEGGIVGVVSHSNQASLRSYNGRQRYDEWEFTYEGVADGNDAGGGPAGGERGGPVSGDLFGGAGSARGLGAPGGGPSRSGR